MAPGLDPWHQTILAEEMWIAGEPRGGQYMNVNWIGPTLIRYGTPDQRERYLAPIVEGRALWCQGFSEPGAGSDLASLRTRAVLLDDGYHVTGQKIWTSYAGLADTCFLVCRTSDDRKRGISILLVPMDTPGITVRQIPSLIGEGDIHEVFFDDMIVPAAARLGEEGEAWSIIAYSLTNERLGIPRYALARAALDRAVAVLKARRGWAGEAVRIEAAQCLALCEAARMASYAIVSARAHGAAVGPESSSARFATIMAERRVAEFVVEYLPDALADAHPYLKMHHQRAIVAGIAAGAAEIQLNIIASDVLKLPREPDDERATLMDLSLTPDQIAILDALDSLAKPYASVPLHDTSLALTSAALDRDLADGGFLDVGFDPDLGTVSAALVVERLARLPFAVEAAISAVVRPLFDADMPRPFCLVEAGRAGRPVRFLAPGATVVVVGADTVKSFVAGADHVHAEDSLFAYPVATLLVDTASVPGTRHAVSPASVTTRWRIALAVEAAGLLAAALDSVAAYVTDRQQFGRPLATFQALRHRLAEAQVRANGVHWLALKAAATLDAGDAALALLHAQESARACVYDFHQFMGAMGMTLEHPLHLWTYRLKALASELDGRGGQALAAADAVWG